MYYFYSFLFVAAHTLAQLDKPNDKNKFKDYQPQKYWNHSSVSSEMETSMSLLYVCIIFSVAVTCFSKNNTTEGSDVSNLNQNVTKPSNSDGEMRVHVLVMHTVLLF